MQYVESTDAINLISTFGIESGQSMVDICKIYNYLFWIEKKRKMESWQLSIVPVSVFTPQGEAGSCGLVRD